MLIVTLIAVSVSVASAECAWILLEHYISTSSSSSWSIEGGYKRAEDCAAHQTRWWDAKMKELSNREKYPRIAKVEGERPKSIAVTVKNTQWSAISGPRFLARTSMQTEIVRCVYCFNNPGMTQDHVPPKSFFPRPRPSDLITVPCCQQCNQGAGKDEEFFLATFMFSEAGATPTGEQLWAEKLDRMYQKNLGLRKTIARGLSHKQVWTPTGLYLGRHMTIKVDHPRLERVVEKIVRGLYYYEYGNPLPANTEVMTIFLNTEAKFHTAQQYFPELGAGSECGRASLSIVETVC